MIMVSHHGHITGNNTHHGRVNHHRCNPAVEDVGDLNLEMMMCDFMTNELNLTSSSLEIDLS